MALSPSPMVRLIGIFHFTQHTLRTGREAPSNQTLMGLGLMMTSFPMQPVMVAVNQQAIRPFEARAECVPAGRHMDGDIQQPFRFMLA